MTRKVVRPKRRRHPPPRHRALKCWRPTATAAPRQPVRAASFSGAIEIAHMQGWSISWWIPRQHASASVWYASSYGSKGLAPTGNWAASGETQGLAPGERW